jgi:hypothetical protein
MGISNCIKCNKVFQKTQSPLCSDCLGATKGIVFSVIDFVVANPGLTVEEVAQQCHLPLKDMEEMLFSGRLGTAAAHIMFKCKGCHKKMSARLRKGQFCPECANKIETKVTQLEREAAAQREKERPVSIRRLPAEVKEKEDHGKPAAEVHASEGVATAGLPEPPKNVPLEVSPKQESVSPASDSYGFKRVSDV